MAIVANGAAVAVSKELTIHKDNRCFEVKQGDLSLGYTQPCFDGRGNWQGWNAFAYTAPCQALTAEFDRVKDALVFITQNGVAL